MKNTPLRVSVGVFIFLALLISFYTPARATDVLAASGCISVPYGLSYGSRGASVLTLQQFLSTRNYPGNGTWIQTGYFGRATLQALKNFQVESGISQTGTVDSPTLSALQTATCTVGTVPVNTVTIIPTVIPTPVTCGSYGSPACVIPAAGAPHIDYLTPVSGAIGSTVGIYGSGFSQSGGNAVHFGTGVIANLFSSDGKTMSFTVPQTLQGYGNQPITLSTYNVSAVNALGIESNAVPFAITSYAIQGQPLITNVSGPNSLTVGGQGVWVVTANTPVGGYLTATVLWGDEVYGYSGNLSTVQSSSVQNQQIFTIPHTYQTTGTYTITFTVHTNDGRQASASTVVNVSNVNSGGQVVVNNVSPSQGPVGTVVTIQGYGFTLSGNTIHFASGGAMNIPSTNNGATLQYVIPYWVSPCDINNSGSCQTTATQVVPGTYPLYVSNASGQSAVYNFSVTQ